MPKVAKKLKKKRLNQFGSIRDFLLKEIRPITSKSKSSEEQEKEEDAANYELEQILNMVRLPLYLEKFMSFSLLACLNCFLYYFTIVPIRLALGCLKKSRFQKVYRERTLLSLIICASIMLSSLDTSRVYHRIKGQSAVKLYMMFGVLEMGDKMLSSVGQDLLATVLSSKNQKNKPKLVVLFVATLTYLTCHAYVLVHETIALNVAVNSYSNSLLTLLLSMQFAEIKASVFKRFDKEGLFQIAISDIVERFQLFIFLTIIALRNLVATGTSLTTLLPNSWTLHATSSVVLGVLCGPMLTVIGSELIVDWVKHAYIIKFNRIKPHIYDKFLMVMCNDHIESLHKLQTRIGLPIPALVVLFIVMFKPTLTQSLQDSSTSIFGATVILILCFICLVLTKFILQLLLVKWAKALQFSIHTGTHEAIYVPGMLSPGMGKVDEGMRTVIHSSGNTPITPPNTPKDDKKLLPPSLSELRHKRDSKHPHSLEKVARYKMVSKRIW